MALRRRRFVEVGSVVDVVRWIVTPDKYEGPKVFEDLAKAEAWAQEKYGLINVFLTMRSPGGRALGDLNFDELEDTIEVGHQVLRTVYRLMPWRDMTVPAEYADPYAAAAAVPEGRTGSVTQHLWFGRPGTKGVQAYGASAEAAGGKLQGVGS